MIAANVLMTRALAPIDMMVSSWRSFIGMRSAFARLEKMLIAVPGARPGIQELWRLSG
jgi:ATP-binding cassette subfamily C exporter for protease/lipase